MTRPASLSPVPRPPSRLRLAVLISGSGRHLENFVRLSRSGDLPADVVRVVSSRPDCGGVARARRLGLEPLVLAPRALGDAFHDHLAQALREARIDLVCMAGFLTLWRIPPDFYGRVMNIHPALLPRFGGRGFYGMRVHRAVLEAGERESGCTVHFADNEYDHGPIILQRRVPVLPGDTPETLADRVFEQERIAYPEAVRLFAEGRIALAGDKVIWH